MGFFQRLMAGRYGRDQLNTCLLVLYLVLWLIGVITNVQAVYTVGLILIVVVVFRMMSRNIERRRAENAKFLKLIEPVSRWFRLRRTIHRDKEHCYFKCPRCGQYLRVPRGKGKLTVTCRSCGASFQEKS
ncbi:MAG: hypothetical protein LUB63_01850 [Oscillospiraceae bacterium]|nr:hypothetical protein [Oscillospiraceae bacterium]